MKPALEIRITAIHMDAKGNIVPECNEIGIIYVADDAKDVYEHSADGLKFHSIEWCESLEEAEADLADFIENHENVTVINHEK